VRTNAGSTEVREQFARVFRAEPDVVASAPGRVNLIGEHTDYNGGFVLPMAIPQRTWAALARRSDGRVRAASANLDNGHRVREFAVGAEEKTRSWIDYVQGVTRAAREAGAGIGGYDLVIDSDVPLGSGLSSSAALEVSVLRGLRELFDLSLDDVALAKIGQRAENDFVGAPVGIMDQMAASLADAHTALFLDTRSLGYEQLPLPTGAALIVINSGVAHSHASGDYRTRRAECERAAASLGASLLRELGVEDLHRVMALPDPLGRRARHVITENQRVLDAVTAIKRGDLAALGALFNASHASQRDDYEVSVPDVDRLVRIAQGEPGVYGARLTGGGFGGSIVALTDEPNAAGAAEHIAVAYAKGGTPKPTVLVPQDNRDAA
jgi:galactokinase